MTYENLRKIQEQQLRIMDEIHKLCVKKNYRYYMIGGSALGAVRHKGFIPWDVDIDIAMPRKDYDAFSTDGYKDLPDFLEFHDYRKDKEFVIPHPIVSLKGSKLELSCGREINNKYGIYVDILPLDQWPENDDKKKKQMKSLKHINVLSKLYNGDEYKENPMIVRLVKKMMRLLMHCLYSSFELNQKRDNIVSMFHTEDEGSLWCSMLSHYSLDKLTMDKEIFGVPILAEFEGRQYYIPQKSELYLQHLFNDYNKLPSIKQQQKLMNLFSYAFWIDKNGIKNEIGHERN